MLTISNNQKSILALKNYEWEILWRELKRGCGSKLDRWLKIFLLAVWWQESQEAKQLMREEANPDQPILIFLKAMSLISFGDEKSIQESVKLAKKLPNMDWTFRWYLLEYFGRSRQFTKQFQYLEKVLSCKVSDKSWPFVALLQSLNQPNVDLTFYKENLEKYSNISPLGKVFAMRCDSKNAEERHLKLDKNNLGAYAMGLYLISSHYYHCGWADKALLSYDNLAKIGLLDKVTINYWLSLSISYHPGNQFFIERANFAYKLAPDSFRAQAIITSYVMIYFWMQGNYDALYNAAKRFHKFSLKEDLTGPEEAVEKNGRVFTKYILNLATFWQLNKDSYKKPGHQAPLYVIGESHCLSLSNLSLAIGEKRYTCLSKFVFGVKMFHLSSQHKNPYKTCIYEHIKSMPMGSSLFFTIGEIDCRPDEGIWNAVKRHKKNMEEVIHETVSEYINYIRSSLFAKEAKLVIIQGVPAPGYSLSSKMPLEEEALFLGMVKYVNKKLQSESLRAGFAFFDVYTATVGANNFSNNKWHIDQYHLKPLIYDTLDQWLVFP